ncbi:helix-turn-helix transcriptional regulator [Natrarchaeobius sp. A-rgal3]|uniref:helix-turn-helix transcriptional regulator n=1 Tax=Natrarchaeobius versutus TaxID=1679078 RepID=UPI0035100BEA
MTPNVSIGARIALAPSSIDARYDAIRTTHSLYDAHTVATRLNDRLSGPLSWMRPFEVSSFWEQALLVVLFVLISGLVALRLAEAATKRDLDHSVRSLIRGTDGNSNEGYQSENTRDHHRGDRHGRRTSNRRGYKRYLSPETPPELLSDEGKVVRLLVSTNGRIRQHEITDETGWSKSKVSRLCSQMHDDGVIEKRSVGRENIIALSETEPNETDGGDETSQSDDVENPLP